MRNNQSGNAIAVVLGILIVVGVIGFAGYRIANHHTKTTASTTSNTNSGSQSQTTSPSTTPASGSSANGTDSASLQNDLNAANSSMNQVSSDQNTANSAVNDQQNEVQVPTN